MHPIFSKHFFKFLGGFLLILVISFVFIAGANARRVPPGTQFAQPVKAR